MRYQVITPPAERPVDLDDLKLHLRIVRDDENEQLLRFLDQATQYLEDELRHVLITTQLRQFWNCFPVTGDLVLLFGPIQSVERVVYQDGPSSTTEVDPAVYEIVPGAWPGRLRLAYDKSWPTEVVQHEDAVQVEYTAGYGDSETDVPERIKNLVRMQVGHVYENREGTFDGAFATKEVWAHAFKNELWRLTARPLA